MYLSESLVVQALRKEYDSWIRSLTAKEKHAIRKYSYNSVDKYPNRFFERLNKMLCGEYNSSDKDMLLKYTAIISGALRKHQLEHPIICYRGSNINQADGLKYGTKFRINQFISTSVIQSKALKGRYFFIIYVPLGTYGAYSQLPTSKAVGLR